MLKFNRLIIIFSSIHHSDSFPTSSFEIGYFPRGYLECLDIRDSPNAKDPPGLEPTRLSNTLPPVVALRAYPEKPLGPSRYAFRQSKDDRNVSQKATRSDPQ